MSTQPQPERTRTFRIVLVVDETDGRAHVMLADARIFAHLNLPDAQAVADDYARGCAMHLTGQSKRAYTIEATVAIPNPPDVVALEVPGVVVDVVERAATSEPTP